MTTYHNPGLPGNGKVASIASLPLFAWAATKPPAAIPFNRAALRIAAKARISFPHAAVVAELMGFTSEACK